MGKLVFAINGQRYELVDNVDPSLTLLEFIRTHTPFRGPKLGCGEGGCGACVVLLATYDPNTDEVNEFSASSCLTLLCSINYYSVTTTEGLGNTKDGYHAIQERIAGFHASQCGFCTPGMCMSIFSALVNADKTSRPQPPQGFSKLRTSEVERAISGNLCRCTGYRPIVDACKSFAADVDLEDLGLNTFWRNGSGEANVNRLPKYSMDGVGTFPEFLKEEIRSSRHETKQIGDGWIRPSNIRELQELLNSSSFDEGAVKMVVGNTSSGVYKDLDLCDQYIDIRGIPELSVVRKSSKGIEIGAAVTISKAIEVLREGVGFDPNSSSNMVFRKIADHMNKVATQFVRNIGSIGGNIIMAQRYAFASDIATILLAAETSVLLQHSHDRINLTLEKFLEGPPCDPKTLLLSIFIPCWDSHRKFLVGNCDSQTKRDVIFETYRSAPRPLGNAVAYVNSALLAQLSVDKETRQSIVVNLHLAFGAYGTQHAIRARKVEYFLNGKQLTSSVLLEAIKLLRATIVPMEGTLHPEYRRSVSVSFLFSFLSPFVTVLTEPERMINHEDAYPVIVSHPNYSSQNYVDADPVHTSLCSRQDITIKKDYFPVGLPVKKVGAEIQASGEAIYVDDIPAPKECLYGAFIYSTQPLAHVKGIHFKPTLASQKIVAVVSAKDIPKGGENVGSGYIFGEERLFADSITQYAGERLAVVVAEKQRYANMAAKQAIVEYGTEGLKPPILTIEDAIERNSYFDIPPAFYPKQIGDFSKGMAEADHKILSAEAKLESQYYFYMETQTALAIPDEDNCILVYSPSQCPEVTQSIISKCLGIPLGNVRVITRRAGGGFGGKAFRGIPVATACALAAYKLRRPVRMYMDRKTDMIMAGGRHPTKVNYSVGFKSDGRITALHVDLQQIAGISTDASPLVSSSVIGTLKKYNWGDLSFDIKLCKTNTTSKSIMRAPGDVQGSFIAEAIIEHVASVLSMDTNTIRRKNLHDYKSLVVYFGDAAGEALSYTLPTIFDKMASCISYEERLDMIKLFNSHNKWIKRGISCVPCTYEVSARPTRGIVSILKDGSVVVEVGGIEIGQGLWTKVKQMAGYALGKLWADGNESIMEKVRVIQTDSLSLIQGGVTGGSTTSESSCEAVRLACNVLVDRLKNIKNRLDQEQSGDVSWNSLISKASQENVNLSASEFWVPVKSKGSYINYGAAVSEVKVDVLTGATTILRSDITYDCGQSLNPAVDLGQVEGAFVQGIGFFIYEEYRTNADGLVVNDGTWTYKIPSVDTIPKQLNVELFSSGHNKNRVLSSKASGEPPLLLAASVHCALREAIRAARFEFSSGGSSDDRTSSIFQMDVPATMPVIKELCGLDVVDKYLGTLSTPNA